MQTTNETAARARALYEANAVAQLRDLMRRSKGGRMGRVYSWEELSLSERRAWLELATVELRAEYAATRERQGYTRGGVVSQHSMGSAITDPVPCCVGVDDRLRREVATWKEEAATWKRRASTENERANASARTVAELRQRVDRLQHELERVDGERQRMNAEGRKLAERVQHLQRDNDSLRMFPVDFVAPTVPLAEHRAVEATLRRVVAERDDYARRLRNVNETVANLNHKLREATDSGGVIALQDEVRAFKAARDVATHQRDIIMREHAEVTDQRDHAKAQLAKAEEEGRTLRRELAAVTNMRGSEGATIGLLRAQVQRLTDKAHFQARNRDRDAEIAERRRNVRRGQLKEGTTIRAALARHRNDHFDMHTTRDYRHGFADAVAVVDEERARLDDQREGTN